jgi:thioredoxin-dependent peroxiredoxin
VSILVDEELCPLFEDFLLDFYELIPFRQLPRVKCFRCNYPILSGNYVRRLPYYFCLALTSTYAFSKHLQIGLSIFVPFRITNPNATGTTQACLFRDNYSHLTESGLSVYGLSTDSPKSNTNFATKQSLPYPLLCDPSATLISAIGMKKAPKSTSRGVFVIDKTGKITAWEQGGPQRTVDVVMAVLPKDGQGSSAAGTAPATDEPKADGANEVVPQQGTAEQVKTADTAAEVADSAEKIDSHVKLGPTA